MPIFELEANGKGYEIEAPNQAAALQAFKGFKPEQPSPLRSQVDDIAKSIGGGLVRGTAGTVGLVTDTLPGLLVKGADKIEQKLRGETDEQSNARTAARRSDPPLSAIGPDNIGTANVQKFIEKITGDAYEPQTTAGKFASTAAEFVPGGAIGKLGNVVRNAITYGVIPGLVSEGAGQVFKDGPAEPYARGIGALGAGFGGAAVNRLGSAERLVRVSAEGATPAQLDQMEALLTQAQRSGVPISRAEALEAVTRGSTGLGDLQHTVEGMGGMKPFYAQRPAQNEAAARQTFDTIAPPSRDPASIGPNAGRAAEAHVNDVRGTINDASQPYYDSARTVSVPPQDMQRVRALPGYPEAVAAVRGDPQLARYVQGMPENSVGFLNEVKKQLDQSATNAANGMTGRQNMQRSAGFGQDATAVRDTARRVSTDYDTALAIQHGGREQILQPILDGPIGKLAGHDTTTKSAIDALFPANPVPNSQAEIGTTIRALSRQRPGIANDLVRAHAEMTFNEAAQRLASGGANQSGGAKFAAVLRGNSQQAANLEAAVTALPHGNETWAGFNRLLDVMEAQQYRQATGSRTAFKIPGVEDLKSGGVVNNAAQIIGGAGIKLPQKVMNAIQNWNVGRNVDQLADLLTNPASAAEFRRIATVPAGSQQAAALIGRVIQLSDRARSAGKDKRP